MENKENCPVGEGNGTLTIGRKPLHIINNGATKTEIQGVYDYLF